MTTPLKKDLIKEEQRRKDRHDRQEELKSQRGYFDSPQRHKGSNSSRGDFEKVENFFFDVGYWATKGSIDFSVGIIAGILAGIKDTVFGSLEAIKNSKNLIIQSQSKQALLNSASNNLSDEDKESLSQGVKISDDEYRVTATLIDDLYKNNEILKNNSGSIAYGEYTFNKIDLKDGNTQYSISRYSPDSNIKVEAFILDKDRNVLTTSNTFSKEDSQKSLELINRVSQKSSAIASNLSINPQPTITNEESIVKITDEVVALNEAILATEIKEGDSDLERLNIKKALVEQEERLLTLEVEINKLSGAIENEIAHNSGNGGASQGVVISLKKLRGMSEAVNTAKQNLTSKQNAANNLDTSTIVNEVQIKVEQSNFTTPSPEGNSSTTNQPKGKTVITTTLANSNFEVDESEVELDYSPDM
jgi:hypothetical protein